MGLMFDPRGSKCMNCGVIIDTAINLSLCVICSRLRSINVVEDHLTTEISYNII